MSTKRRESIALLVVAAVLVAGLLWAVVPRRLGPVRIESVAVGNDAGRTDAPPIAITFAPSENLAAARARLGMDYIAARLFACGDERTLQQAVITQLDETLPDQGRVRRLGAGPDGRGRFRAVFSGRLATDVGDRVRFSPAVTAPGGLCLRLYGARMWFGTARSAVVPVPLPRH